MAEPRFKTVLELKVEAGEAEKATKSVKTQMRELKEELLSLDESDPKFKEVQANLAKMQEKVNDVTEATRNLAQSPLELSLAGVAGATETVVAGFTAYESIVALTGSENKELQETLVRLQGAMGLLNSIQAISNNLKKESALRIAIDTAATKLYDAAIKQAGMSQIAFNIALGGAAALGIVAVIGAIILAQDNLSEATKLATKYQNDYNKALKEAKLDIEAERIVLMQKLAIAQDENQSLKDRREALRQIKKEQPEYFGNLEIETINTKAATVAVENYTRAMTSRALVMAAEGQLVEIGKEILIIEQERAEAVRKRNQDITNTPESVTGKIAQIEYDFKVKTDALNQREVAGRERLTVLQGIISKNAAQFLAITGDTAPEAKKVADETERIQQSIEHLNQTAIGANNNPFNPVTESLSFLEKQAKNAKAALLDLTPATDEYNAVRAQSAEKDAESAQRALDAEQRLFHARQQLYQGTASIFGALSQVLQEEGQKQTDIQKALALVELAINTGVAISNAVRTTSAPTPDNVATGGLAGATKFLVVSAQILTSIASARRIIEGGKGGGQNIGSAASSVANTRAPQGLGSSQQPQQPQTNITVQLSERQFNQVQINSREISRGALTV